MDDVFDAVVVGSGFGGAVSACRLAEAGLSVCVLERGRAYPPGSFPRSPKEMGRNVWDPSEGLQGLFDIWSFRRIDAIVASGLGGGSLIYANVLIRKPERWFMREHGHQGGYEYWPVSRAQLDPMYDRVEHALGATRYPSAEGGYPALAKTTALRTAARRMGLEHRWELPNLAVSFGHPPYPGSEVQEDVRNLHGVPRRTCQLSGECDFGCNNGAKNTLDLTYLSRAAATGLADLRPRCEARSFDHGPGKAWTVRYVRHEPENEGSPIDTRRLPLHTVRARILVLAAGVFGTTYLLLANRAAIPRVSPTLGTRFSGNGDFLAFLSSRSTAFSPSHGPVITSTIRFSDEADGGPGRGFYLQDGGYPGLVDWLVEELLPMGVALRAGRLVLNRLRRGVTGTAAPGAIGAQMSELLGSGDRSSGGLPLLGIGRDMPSGIMRLRSGYLAVDWNPMDSAAYTNRLRRALRSVGNALDSRYRDGLSYLLSRSITVHPLGGAPMGRERSEGVVDDHGEVFGYPGLFVADGSVMPGPVGANPSLTIAALAERFSGRMIERARHG